MEEKNIKEKKKRHYIHIKTSMFGYGCGCFSLGNV